MVEKIKSSWIYIRKYLSLGIIASIFIGILYFIIEYREFLNFNLEKVNKSLNNKMFGSIVNLTIVNSIPFLYDWISEGYTISTIMNINHDSSSEDKRNATYFMCAVLVSNALIASVY